MSVHLGHQRAAIGDNVKFHLRRIVGQPRGVRGGTQSRNSGLRAKGPRLEIKGETVPSRIVPSLPVIFTSANLVVKLACICS